MDVQEEEPKGYPKAFLFGLAGVLRDDLNQLFAAYLVPTEAVEALNTAEYLDCLANEDPKTFHPGGAAGWEREVAGAIQEAAWLREKVTELRREKVHSLTEEEHKAGQALIGTYKNHGGL